MNGTNLVVMVGNVGGPPEKRMTSGGTAVLNFSLAVNDTWKDKSGQKQERVEWVRVAIFGPAAQGLGTFLAKGHLVSVVGRMRTDEYLKDNEKRYSTQVIADRVQVLSSKGDGHQRAPAGPSGPQQAIDALERQGKPVPPAPSSAPDLPPDDFHGGAYDDEIPF